MILTDYHVHSEFSTDSKAKQEDIINKAISLGLKSICFTDHYDMDFPSNNDFVEFQLDTDKYFSALKDLQDKYANKIDIRIGVELGLMEYLDKRIHNYVSNYDFDFVIGSSHLVNGVDPYDKIYFEGITEDEGFHKYFQSIYDNTKAISDFNVYGHLDYVVRYSPSKAAAFVFDNHRDLFCDILRLLISTGRGIEINTAGIKKIGYAHPHLEILKLYKNLGGEIITFGSDSHIPDNLSYGFEEYKDLLKSLNFKYYTEFKKQKPYFILL